MSLSLEFDHSGDAGQIANAAGWYAFHQRISQIPLERCLHLAWLASDGYTSELNDLEKETAALIKAGGNPEGVQEILQALLKALKNRDPKDEQVAVTDGCDDEDEDDEDEDDEDEDDEDEDDEDDDEDSAEEDEIRRK